MRQSRSRISPKSNGQLFALNLAERNVIPGCVQGLPRSPNAHDRHIERSAFALREALQFYELPVASQSVIATAFLLHFLGCRVAGLAIKRAALQRSTSRMAPGFSGVYLVYHTRN